MISVVRIVFTSKWFCADVTPSIYSVKNVVTMREPLKVVCVIVGSVKVFMIYFGSLKPSIYKRLCNENVYALSFVIAVVG